MFQPAGSGLRLRDGDIGVMPESPGLLIGANGAPPERFAPAATTTRQPSETRTFDATPGEPGPHFARVDRQNLAGIRGAALIEPLAV